MSYDGDSVAIAKHASAGSSRRGSVASDGHSIGDGPDERVRRIGLLGMAFYTFVSTSAGPSGIESAIQAGGVGMTLIMVIVMPLCFILPVIFIVWELVAWMPTNHGSIRWVSRAFGTFGGFVNCIFQLAMYVIDIAVYPVLATNYLEVSFWPEMGYWERIVVQALFVLAGGVPCLFNIKHVTAVCAFITVCISIPFIIAVTYGLPSVEPKILAVIHKDIPFSALRSGSIGIYTGLIGNGNLAGEVKTHRQFLLGQLLALCVDVSMYVLPVVVVARIPGAWGDGFLVTAFEQVMPGIGVVMSIAGMMSGYGLFLSSLACYSRALWGAADLGWAPRIFAHIDEKCDSPRPATIFFMVSSVVLGFFDFNFLVEMEFVIASVIYILFAACFVVLRYTEPDAPRPVQVPGGRFSAWLLPAPIIIFMSACFGSSVVKWQMAVGFLVSCATTMVLYFAFYRPQLRKQQKAAHDEGGSAPDFLADA